MKEKARTKRHKRKENHHHRHKDDHHEHKETKKMKNNNQSADDLHIPNNRIAYIKSLENDETIEYVHCTLSDAHVFKLPKTEPKEGWKATEMIEEVWQGTIKVLNRDIFSGLLLLDRFSNNIFAVCPIETVQRCQDSSRYFVVQVRKPKEGHFGLLGIAFNERSAAFEFNVAIETCMLERHTEDKTGEEGNVTMNPSKDMDLAFPRSPNSLLRSPNNTEAKEKETFVPFSGSFPLLPWQPLIQRAVVPLLKPHKNDTKKHSRKISATKMEPVVEEQENPLWFDIEKLKTIAEKLEVPAWFGTIMKPVAKQEGPLLSGTSMCLEFEQAEDEAARVQHDRCLYGMCCATYGQEKGLKNSPGELDGTSAKLDWSEARAGDLVQAQTV